MAALGPLLAASTLASCTTANGQRGPAQAKTVQHDRDVAPDAAPAGCARRGVELLVTPPSTRDRRAGNVATLRASFAGEGRGERARNVCLVEGERARLVPGEVTTEMRADASALQRIVVDGRAVLLHVPPGETVRIAHHPCVDWMLVAEWLDDGTMTSGPSVEYGRTDQTCPEGFIDGGRIHEAEDPRCGGVDECEWKRCVQQATLRLASEQGRPVVLRNGTLHPLEQQPYATTPYGGFCPVFEQIETPAERVLIAPGVGEQWRLRLDDDGRLRGIVEGARTEGER